MTRTLNDARELLPRFFQAGRGYEDLGRRMGNCILVRADDGKPTWVCEYRFAAPQRQP